MWEAELREALGYVTNKKKLGRGQELRQHTHQEKTGWRSSGFPLASKNKSPHLQAFGVLHPASQSTRLSSCRVGIGPWPHKRKRSDITTSHQTQNKSRTMTQKTGDTNLNTEQEKSPNTKTLLYPKKRKYKGLKDCNIFIWLDFYKTYAIYKELLQFNSKKTFYFL